MKYQKLSHLIDQSQYFWSLIGVALSIVSNRFFFHNHKFNEIIDNYI